MKSRVGKKIGLKTKKELTFLFYGLSLCAILFLIDGYKHTKDSQINIAETAKYYAQKNILFGGKLFFKKNKEDDSSSDDYDKKIKIVIVPGHKNVGEGTSFRGVNESEMNLELSLNLAEFLKNEEGFEAIVTRNKKSYNKIFSDYFENNKKSITEFMKSKKDLSNQLIRLGEIDPIKGIIHNNVSAKTALELYGINKWSNENDIDAVIHIHFNDYPGRMPYKEGKYSGFSIYVPEAQYRNAKASRAMAESIFNQLQKFYPTSNFPQEQDGIVEDQKLIAIGAHSTLDPVGMLIEYGYIYESQFLNEKIRKFVLRDLALQTYIGIVNFFEKDKKLSLQYDTFFLPHKWNETMKRGDTGNESILALQTALVFEKLYPPDGFDKNKCPITGNFGNCTLLALQKFQEKYSINNETGMMGESTKDKLNELYSR